MAYKIFISHGWSDRWVASQIARRLNEIGVETFIDVNDLHIGDLFADKIFNEIPKCDELIALFTPKSQSRSWVWLEIGAAKGHKKRIVAILYNTTLEIIEKEHGVAFLKESLTLDLNEIEAYFEQVKKRI